MKKASTKRCGRCKEAKKASAFFRSQWCNGAWCKACYRFNYVNNSDKIRWSRIFRDYGLSQADYKCLFEEQGGLCAICKKPERTKRFKFLAVDHDHVTNKIRGLLCHRCNAGLGNFNDDVKLMREAVNYLENHGLKVFRADVRNAFPEFAVESHFMTKRQPLKTASVGVF